MAWKHYFLTVSVLCAAVGFHLVTIKHTWTEYIMICVLVAASVIAYHVRSLQPSPNMPLSHLLSFYMEYLLMRTVGMIFTCRFKAACQNVGKTQTKTLEKLLLHAKGTEYGKEHNFADIKNITEFTSRMRLTTYDDYKVYIDRVLDGEENVLFKEDVNYFAATSGTTSGKSKLIPINTSFYWRQLSKSMFMSFSSFVNTYPNARFIKPYQYLGAWGRTLTTDRGVKKGSVSTQLWTQRFFGRIPREFTQIHDENTALYVNLVFALSERDIGHLFAMTSALLFKILCLLERDWKMLVRDVRRGELDVSLEVPERVRHVLNEHLKPLPDRADELTAIFDNGFKHIVPKIWPHLYAISGMTCGNLAVQTQVVRNMYIGPDIPFFSTTHAATEGVYGQVLFEEGPWYQGTGDVRDDYTILTNMNFYEFIPIDNVDEDQPQTLLAHQVTKDQEYELVITSARGFYRYRTGDLIRICGYLGDTPKYRLLQRVGDVLNLSTEKVPETVFREAMTETAKEWTSSQLLNYVVTENVHVDRITGHLSSRLVYVVFMETKDNEVLQSKAAESLDRHLCSLADTYNGYRKKGTISPPHLIHVTKGSFDLVKDLAQERNPLMLGVQYKYPRIIRDEEKLRILLNNRLKTSEKKI